MTYKKTTMLIPALLLILFGVLGSVGANACGEENPEFIGTWLNDDPNTFGNTRIVVTCGTDSNGQPELKFESWRFCDPRRIRDCPNGKVPATTTTHHFSRIHAVYYYSSFTSFFKGLIYDYGPRKASFTERVQYPYPHRPDMVINGTFTLQ